MVMLMFRLSGLLRDLSIPYLNETSIHDDCKVHRSVTGYWAPEVLVALLRRTMLWEGLSINAYIHVQITATHGPPLRVQVTLNFGDRQI